MYYIGGRVLKFSYLLRLGKKKLRLLLILIISLVVPRPRFILPAAPEEPPHHGIPGNLNGTGTTGTFEIGIIGGGGWGIFGGGVLLGITGTGIIGMGVCRIACRVTLAGVVVKANIGRCSCRVAEADL